MTDAPKQIWAQDAEPRECNFIGGGWWDDEIGSTQYPHMVEYHRADLSADLVRAALERAAEIAEAAMKKHARETYSGEPVKVFAKNSDTIAQSAAKTYCAGAILEAIRTISADPKAIAAIVARVTEGE